MISQAVGGIWVSRQVLLMDFFGIHINASRLFSTISSSIDGHSYLLALHKQLSSFKLLCHFLSSADTFYEIITQMQFQIDYVQTYCFTTKAFFCWCDSHFFAKNNKGMKHK